MRAGRRVSQSVAPAPKGAIWLGLACCFHEGGHKWLEPRSRLSSASHILADFRSCPTKCARSHFQEWKPKLQSIHLHAGGAFAKGLEVTRRSFYEQGKGVEDSVSDGVRALLVAYGDFDAQRTRQVG